MRWRNGHAISSKVGEEKKKIGLGLQSRANLKDNYLRSPAAERTPFQIPFGEMRWRIAARTAFEPERWMP